MKILVDVDDELIEGASRAINPVNSEKAVSYVIEPEDIKIFVRPRYAPQVYKEAEAQRLREGGDHLPAAQILVTKFTAFILEDYKPRS